MGLKDDPLTRPSLIGMGTGLVYGVLARFVADNAILGPVVGVMTFAFLFVVPFVIGFLTVRPVRAPSWTYRLLAPWLPTLLAVLVCWLVGWEGAICIVMGLPVLLVGASLGGVVAAMITARRARHAALAMLAPFALAPLERLAPRQDSLRTVESAIPIAASPGAVWRQIIEVPAIQPEERQPALFTRMGFPRPTRATLAGQGVGAVRQARFEGGVLFLETITDWEPERLLAFSIRPQTDSIPVTTLDRHVVVGGPYFDVLRGTYRIEPRAGGGVVLHLASRLRVTTPFNLYAGPWADAIMRSIQQNILAVIRRRAETTPS